MDIKMFLNPRQFVNQLPKRFSWYLLLTLVVTTIIKLIPYLFILDLDLIKKALLIRANFPADTIVSNTVIAQALAMLFFTSLLFYIAKVGILTLIFKGILNIFKRDVAYFKLINIYMYAKISSEIISLFGILVVISNDTLKTNLVKALMKEISLKQFVWPMYGNYIFTILVVLSAIVFYGILVYGTLKSIKKK